VPLDIAVTHYCAKGRIMRAHCSPAGRLEWWADIIIRRTRAKKRVSYGACPDCAEPLPETLAEAPPCGKP
jgi:hypothetical protein